MATVRCFCDCHRSSPAALYIAPDVRSPVDAVTACNRCLNAHTIALVSEWPIVPPINPQLAPWIDHQQADGGEGRED